MASYSTITAAIALGIDRKRLENLLLRCRIPGASRGRQGRARRLSRSSLLALAAVVRLQDELGIPATRAAELIVGGLVAGGAGTGAGDSTVSGRHTDRRDAPLVAGSTLRRGPFALSVDILELDRDLANALAEAVEMSPRPRRGRPAGTGRGPRG